MRASTFLVTASWLLVSPFAQSARAGGKIHVFVSIAPQEYFVERVGGDRVTVQALVKPGSSPATYEPAPRQMASLSEAKLFFRIGVPFENAFLPKIKEIMKELKIVDTRRGISLRIMKARHHHEASEHAAKPEARGTGNAHHAEDEREKHHRNDGTDPHIWLNPRLVKTQARTIANALIEIDPAGKGTYEKNCRAFAGDLDALDAKLVKALAPVKGKTFLVFHPAWGYFADAYGLKQEPIEIEGKEPSARQLAGVIEKARAEDVRVIFVQPQFSRASAQKIAESTGGAVVPIDPLARNYIENMEAVASAVGKSLGRQK